MKKISSSGILPFSREIIFYREQLDGYKKKNVEKNDPKSLREVFLYKRRTGENYYVMNNKPILADPVIVDYGTVSDNRI